MAADKIKVQTSDGDILEVDLDIAKQWGPIKTIFEVLGGVESQEKPIQLENINTPTLNKIIEWATHHRSDGLATEGSENKKQKIVDISEWDQNYLKVKQETLFELIMAANYLDIQPLLDMACKTVANMIKDKTPEEVRQIFNIPNDLPPLEQPQ